MRNLLKPALVALACFPLAATTIGPASAAKPTTYESRWLYFSDTQSGQVDGLEGNAHRISVWGDSEGYADGWIGSYQCPEGEVPTHEEEGACEYVGGTELWGDSLAVDVDPDLGSGSLAGSMQAFSYDPNTDEYVELDPLDVDAVVTGTGEVMGDTYKYKGEKATDAYRPGTAEGTLGSLVLTDASGELGMSTGSYKERKKYQDRYAGEDVSLDWTEFGELPGVAGNAHVGTLWVGGEGWADGKVVDWTCPEGEQPPSGGGHGEDPHAAEEWPEEPETNCVQESVRFMWSDETLELTMDRKLDEATITGTLEVQDHDGGSGGSPTVDITVTGTGEVSMESGRGKWADEYDSGSYSYSSTSREGTVDGFIGLMGFADDSDDLSSARMSTYKSKFSYSS